MPYLRGIEKEIIIKLKNKIMKAVVEGKKVIGKYGAGTIVEILTASTGYVVVKWDNENIRSSKVMAFNLTDENGKALKAMPKSKPAKEISAEEKFYCILRNINDKKNSSYEGAQRLLTNIELFDTRSKESKIACFCNTMSKASESQLILLAKYAAKNNL